MLDEKKIRLMTKLARYESGQGQEDLKIAGYYRSDYLGLELLKNFFLATIGYGVILLLIASYFSEYLMNNIHKMNLPLLVVLIIGGYLVTLTIYSVVTYTKYSLKYSRAKRSVEYYDRKLAELQKYYGKEEPKAEREEARRKNV